jgi:hypothetical protein
MGEPAHSWPSGSAPVPFLFCRRSCLKNDRRERLIAAIAKHVAAPYDLAGQLGLKITHSVNVDAYCQFRVIGALDPY